MKCCGRLDDTSGLRLSSVCCLSDVRHLIVLPCCCFSVKRFREPVGIRRPWRIWSATSSLIDTSIIDQYLYIIRTQNKCTLLRQLFHLFQVLWHVQTGHRCSVYPLCQRLPVHSHQRGSMLSVSHQRTLTAVRCNVSIGNSLTTVSLWTLPKVTWWISCWTQHLECWSSGWLWSWCPSWWSSSSGACSRLENMVGGVK